MRTALDLQAEGALDLAELAAACEAAGLGAMPAQLGGDGFFLRWPDRETHDWIRRDEIDTEMPRLAFALRDAVRKVAPGSYCIPVPTFDATRLETPPLRVRLADEWGHWPPKMDPAKLADGRYRRIPHTLFGRTETECWARALVALYRAGLLGEVTT